MFISGLPSFDGIYQELPACLRALRRQTFPAERYEVIVVDNASTDATAAVARRWKARVVTEPRKGVSRARQAGFQTARGQVIASTDADTRVPPDWLARIDADFEGDPALGGVYGPVHWPDGRPGERLMLRYPGTWALWASNRAGRSLWWGSNFAVRREVFWQAGGFPVDWPSGEDTDLSPRVSRTAGVRFDPALVVRTSNRRAKEGGAKIVQRGMVNVVNRFLLRRSPLSMPVFGEGSQAWRITASPGN